MAGPIGASVTVMAMSSGRKPGGWDRLTRTLGAAGLLACQLALGPTVTRAADAPQAAPQPAPQAAPSPAPSAAPRSAPSPAQAAWESQIDGAIALLNGESFADRARGQKRTLELASVAPADRLVARLRALVEAKGAGLEERLQGLAALRGLAMDGPPQAAALAFEALNELANGPREDLKRFANDAFATLATERRQSVLRRLTALGANFAGVVITFNQNFRGGDSDLFMLNALDVQVVRLKSCDRLTDKALEHLATLKNLQQVQIEQCPGISDEAVAKLRKAKPSAQVFVFRGAFLGVAGADHPKGCLVAQVIEGSVAQRAGVQVGDVVLALGAETVTGMQSLVHAIGKHKPGQEVRMQLLRQGQPLTLTVKLGQRPDE